MAQKILVLTTFILGFLVRLYKIDSPLADWHSHRQADTASVTRNFYEKGIDLLHPTYHDLSNVQSGKDNPQGYRMVEFPLYNLLSLIPTKFGLSVEISSRLTSIFLSLVNAILIFFICFDITKNFWPSYLALFNFLFLPFSIFYSRAILPENLAVTLMLFTLFLFPKNILLSSIFFSAGLLTKPYIGFLLFPVLLFYSLKLLTRLPRNCWGKSFLILFSLVSLAPFLLWRRWIQQFPEGIPSNLWLFNTTGSRFGQEWYRGYNLDWLYQIVAFRPHWFQWLFYERIGKLILGAFGLIPAFLGLAYRKNHSQKISILFLLGIVLYFVIVAQGNIQHDYYQILVIPFLSIFLGFGYFYLTNFVFSSKFFACISSLFIFLFSTYFSWLQVKEFYHINNPSMISAGQRVNEITPKNSLVIAPYVGDTAFLYQTHRCGWPVEVYNFDSLIQTHPNNPIYLVSVNFDQYTNSLIPKFPAVYKDNQYIILKISP